jgi:hypothetical protein
VVQLDRKVPPTRYTVATVNGVAAVEARAERSMALLARPISVDLAATPIPAGAGWWPPPFPAPT